MPKRPLAAEAESQPANSSTEAVPNFWLKLLVSGLIAFHLTAVFIAPFAFACRTGVTGSPFADPVYQFFRPYLAALYLDHGYFFFAPDPGPNHLVDYRVEFDDGRPPITGRFPDLATERPRLLYHRHFMVAESLNNRFVPPTPPPEPTPPPLTAGAEEKILYQQVRAEYERQLTAWRHARMQYTAMQKSLTDHLLSRSGGSRVTLTRVEHLLANPDAVQYAGRKLNASESYVNLPENPRAEDRR